MTITRRLTTLGLLALLLAPSRSLALSWTSVPESLDDLVEETALAFRGEVRDVEYDVVYGPAKQRLPYTRVQFRVEKAYRGCKPGQTVTLFQLGGRIPGTPLAVAVPGLPQHAVGDHSIVFSNDALHGFTGALYGELGVRRIAWDAGGNDYVLTHDWRLLPHGTKYGSSSATVRCRTDRKRRDTCIEFEAGGKTTSKAPGGFLSIQDFDQAVYASLKRTGPRKGPSQTVTANEKSFRKFLARFFEAGSVSTTPSTKTAPKS